MKAVKKVEGPTKTLAVREVPVHPTIRIGRAIPRKHPRISRVRPPRGGAEPAQNDPSDADSATTGSVSREGFGRLVGEQLAYAWFEAVVARGEEP
jgi:hypothetical protein